MRPAGPGDACRPQPDWVGAALARRSPAARWQAARPGRATGPRRAALSLHPRARRPTASRQPAHGQQGARTALGQQRAWVLPACRKARLVRLLSAQRVPGRARGRVGARGAAHMQAAASARAACRPVRGAGVHYCWRARPRRSRRRVAGLLSGRAGGRRVLRGCTALGVAPWGSGVVTWRNGSRGAARLCWRPRPSSHRVRDQLLLRAADDAVDGKRAAGGLPQRLQRLRARRAAGARVSAAPRTLPKPRARGARAFCSAASSSSSWCRKVLRLSGVTLMS